ncbi:MAG: hypothetical protein ACI4LM_05925, partial [Anaerovoracaceae bacterium]
MFEKRRRKLLVLLMSVLMTFTLMPAAASAQPGGGGKAGKAAAAPRRAPQVSEYILTLNVKDKQSGAAITDAKVTLTYEAEDEDWSTYTETVSPETDGTYKLEQYTEYTLSIKKEGYADYSETFTHSGNEAAIAKEVGLQKKSQALDKVTKVKEAFEKNEYVLRPYYGTDKNINEYIAGRIKKYEGVDTEGVTVSVKSIDDENYISSDGTIRYNKSELDSGGNNVKNIGCVFTFSYDGASADSDSHTVTVGWDVPYYNSKMAAEKDQLTFDTIKGENTSADEITKDLSLPLRMNKYFRQAWSTIKWTSSNEDVIKVEGNDWDSTWKGTVTQPAEDTEVTLTAAFNVNTSNLNGNVDKEADFPTLTKEFKVKVKGTGAAVPTEEELKALLDKYYTADMIKVFDSHPEETADLNDVKSDLQLPRYTKIKDEKGDYVFANKEITVTSSNDAAAKVNGYRVAIDPFAKDADKPVTLKVTFTREGVTAEKDFTLKINTKSQDLDAEIAKMEKAKEHYFDALNNGAYRDKDSITGDLHPFQEIRIDGENVTYVYSKDDVRRDGIKADGYFTDSWEMEAAGYNCFKSSDPDVIQHENLVVKRPETSKQVTITSWLSSEKYGNLAESHPENEKLQKLHKQEVSVTVTVKGTKGSSDALKAKIDEAKELSGRIVEGTE